jgi:hypothetical protein
MADAAIGCTEPTYRGIAKAVLGRSMVCGRNGIA